MSAPAYCGAGTTNGCSIGDHYASFTTSGGATNISHNPGDTCVGDASGRASFSGAGLSASAPAGTLMNFSITNAPVGTGFPPGDAYAIWVDWNQDRIFESSEEVYASGIVAPGGIVGGTFPVPLGAVPGTTDLRIRSRYSNTAIDPCTFYSGDFGITFDFPFAVLGTAFVNASPQSLMVCRGSGANPINSLLAVNDPSVGLTETWTIASPPAHGILSGFGSATATSNGGVVTPTGLTYTPTITSGSDVFTIQVSDGAATATTTVNVTISSPNVATLTLTASSVCPGSGSLVTIDPTTLTDGTYTINYALSAPTSAAGTATVNISGGNGSFTTSQLSGTSSVTINSVTNAGSCISASGSSTIATTLPLPNPLEVGGGGAYCAGSAGPDITVAPPTQLGVTYALYFNGVYTGVSTGGNTAGLGFGPESAPGAYTVVATNTFTGCSSAMPGSVAVSVNPLPAQYSVTITSGGHYCAGGTGVSIGLTNSDPGVIYQLFQGSTLVSTRTPGGGGFIFLTPQTVAGTYTVTAQSASTTCTVNMSGSGTVFIDPLPDAIANLSAVCTGQTIVLSDPTPDGTWSSSNTGQATVVESGGTAGTVTGVLGLSTPVITYTLPTGCSVSGTVTVNPGPQTISGSSLICVNATTQLIEIASGGIWSSSNTLVATVGSTGIVTGVTPDAAVISYTIPSGCAATFIVTVNALPPAISGNVPVCSGATIGLGDLSLGGTWESNNNTQASVGSISGIVTGGTGILPANPVITYTALTGCTITAVLTVNPAPAAISGSAFVCVGLTTPLVDATSGGTWSSSNNSLATVLTGSVSGNVTGVSNGIPTIIYTLPTGCTAKVPVTVNPLPSSISGASSVCTNSTIGLTDAGGGTWISSDETKATVTGLGVVTGALAGTTTITYTLPTGCATSLVVTVNQAPFAITPSAATVCVGLGIILSDGTPGGTWTSSNNAEANVSSPGPGTITVTGGTASTPTITYTTPAGCFVTNVVTVNPLPSAITGAASVCTGAAISLTDAGGGAWSTSDGTQATVSGSGLVSGVPGALGGSITITYTLPTSCSITKTISVNPTPGPISIAAVCPGTGTPLSDGITGGTWTAAILMRLL